MTTKQIDPGVGWRLLADEEEKLPGDEATWMSGKGPWVETPDGGKQEKGLVYRRRVEPTKQIDGKTWIPWTRETCPVGSVVVSSMDKVQITRCNQQCCYLVSTGYVLYADMLTSAYRHDGKPCGTCVEPKWRPAMIDDIDKQMRAKFRDGGVVCYGILVGWISSQWVAGGGGTWPMCEVQE
jgi:hypothetical protein